MCLGTGLYLRNSEIRAFTLLISHILTCSLHHHFSIRFTSSQGPYSGGRSWKVGQQVTSLCHAAAHSYPFWVLLQHLSPHILLTSKTFLGFQDLSSSRVLPPPLWSASCLVILPYVPSVITEFRTCHFCLVCALAKFTTSLDWLQLASNSSILDIHTHIYTQLSACILDSIYNLIFFCQKKPSVTLWTVAVFTI